MRASLRASTHAHGGARAPLHLLLARSLARSLPLPRFEMKQIGAAHGVEEVQTGFKEGGGPDETSVALFFRGRSPDLYSS